MKQAVAETVEGETPAEEKKEEAVAEEKVEAPVEEKKEPVEEDLHAHKLTLAEYLAQKKKTTFKKEGRAHDNTKPAAGAKVEAAPEKKEKVVGLSSTLRDQEVYNVAVGKSELSNLLHFQGTEEPEFQERGGDRRGGRGGRGGARGGRGGRVGGDEPRKGGRQQQLRVDDNAFPSLA